jgi:hypothetical protein
MHDAQVCYACLDETDRLREDGAVVRGVVRDHELKREYQQLLQERYRGTWDSAGRTRSHS